MKIKNITKIGLTALAATLLANNANAATLRSADEIDGYKIMTSDNKKVGEVSDVIFNDTLWTVPYLVVDRTGWGSGDTVISPSWVLDIDWIEEEIEVGFSKETFDESPDYDLHTPIDRTYEMRLYDYYDKDPYWDEVDVY